MLALLPFAQQRKVRALLNYNPETAGGLMSPDFLCLPESTPVQQVLEARPQRSQAPPEALAVVFARGDDGRVSGSASVVRSRPGRAHRPRWARWSAPILPTCTPTGTCTPSTRKMTDFNLTVAPVMDEQHRMVGVITVDDVLEMLLPTGWRRDFGMTSVEE